MGLLRQLVGLLRQLGDLPGFAKLDTGTEKEESPIG